MWRLLLKQFFKSEVLGIECQHFQSPMDTDHLRLQLLEILLQTLQLICRFIICSDGLIDHAADDKDEFQSGRNEAYYASRDADWVHNGSDGPVGSDQ